MMLPFVNILPSGPTGIGASKIPGSGPMTSGDGNGQTFESLMNLFGMSEPATVAPLINSDRSTAESTDPATSVLTAEALLASLLATPGLTKQMHSGIEVTSSMNPMLSGAAEPFDATDALPLTNQPEISLPLEQPLSLPVAQPWTMTMTQQRPVNLKPGKYQVLKQQLTDGKLTLDLKNTGSSSEPLKVTIPIELLHQESHDAIAPASQQFAGAKITPARVPLASSPAADFESLFDKVNVREMELSIDRTSAVYQASDEPIKVQLVAAQAGQELSFAGKLNRSQLKAQVTVKKNVSPFATLPPSENPTPAAADGLTVDTVTLPRRRLTGKVAFESDGQPKSDDSTLIQKLLTPNATDTATHKDGSEQLTFKAAQPVSSADPSTKMDIPKVKLTLPQDMPLAKVDGQTVLLKIEPEHLGPAKLQLTVKNDSLSARVTVDSVQAKAAVERSLDQLNDQLLRAGVRVGYIEVNVRGGGADSQFFHRQAEWFRSQQPRIARLTDEVINEVSRVMPGVGQSTYLNAGSVNLFA